jgi:hypothetical protein
VELKACLHVTSAAAIPSILKSGLVAQIGPLSSQVETHPAVFLFPSWDDMMDANWLFDEDTWPHESEPALLCVNTEGLLLDAEVGYEAVFRENIPASRLTVIAPGESDWYQAENRFLELGGRKASLTEEEIFSNMVAAGRLPAQA